MRSCTSPQMERLERMNMSRVWFTTPSVEFSTGTTPNCAAPDSTSRKTASMLSSGLTETA